MRTRIIIKDLSNTVFGWTKALTEVVNALDKKESLGQNKTMRLTTFDYAVLSAVKELRAKGPFSIHDVTALLRAQANTGQVGFKDATPEVIDGRLTFAVQHTAVKEMFEDALAEGLLTGLTSTFNGTYRVFENTPVPTPASPPYQYSKPCVCSPAPAVSPKKNSSLCGTGFAKQIDAYLDSKSGYVTMKQIQSRFDKQPYTCAEYGEILEDLGYAVDNSGQYPSKWTVSV